MKVNEVELTVLVRKKAVRDDLICDDGKVNERRFDDYSILIKHHE